MLKIVCTSDIILNLALKMYQDEGNSVAVIDRIRECFTEINAEEHEAVFVGSLPTYIENFQKFVQNWELSKNFFSFTVSPNDLLGFLSEEYLDRAIELFNKRSTSCYVDPSDCREPLTCVDGSDEFEVFIPCIVTDLLDQEFYLEQQLRLEEKFWTFVKSCEELDGTYRSGKEKCYQKK